VAISSTCINPSSISLIVIVSPTPRVYDSPLIMIANLGVVLCKIPV